MVKARTISPLIVRLDESSKSVLATAAKLRGVSVSDYVRQITIAQARREVEAASESTIVMTAEDQLAFWNALQAPVQLTKSQKKLSKLIRGKS